MLVHRSREWPKIPKMWEWLQNQGVGGGWKTVRNTNVKDVPGEVSIESEKSITRI